MATLPEVKPGDAITARWANAITQICRRVLRITVAPPLQAHIGPSGIHLSLASQPAGSALRLFQVIATADGSDWIEEGVDQNDYLRSGIMPRGGFVYALRMRWWPEGENGTGKLPGKWIPTGDLPGSGNLSTPAQRALIFDSTWSHVLGPGDLAWCTESSEAGRWEIVSSTNY